VTAPVKELFVLAPVPVGLAAPFRAEVARLEALGVDGVFAGDHLFVQDGLGSGTVLRPGEPLTLLASAGMASDRLLLALMVANLSFVSPVTVARAGAQLAALYGGDRVWIGVGAGWNEPEFRAIGRSMPSHGDRMARLREGAALLRGLFDDGKMSFHGQHVRVDNLPLSPLPATPPRLLVGGGSHSVLDIAARVADVVDLNAPYQGAERGGGWAGDARRRLVTSIDDVARAIDEVSTRALAYGRSQPLFAINVDVVVVGDEASTSDACAALCRRWDLELRSLERCPYVLLGTAESIWVKMQAIAGAGVRVMAVENGAEPVCGIRGLHRRLSKEVSDRTTPLASPADR